MQCLFVTKIVQPCFKHIKENLLTSHALLNYVIAKCPIRKVSTQLYLSYIKQVLQATASSKPQAFSYWKKEMTEQILINGLHKYLSQ